jgi:CBS domain-containing protein
MLPPQPPTAGDFMNTHVHTVAPETPLEDVVAFLLKHRISNAPVVETDSAGGRRLVGFLSEGDCLERLSNEMFFGRPSQPQTAATIMRRHPVCVTPDTDVFTLASLFATHRFRHLPVVEQDRFVGMVSRRDILRALEGYYRQMLQAGEDERQVAQWQQTINYRLLARSL